MKKKINYHMPVRKVFLALTLLSCLFVWQGCSDDNEDDVIPPIDLTSEELVAAFEEAGTFIELPENAKEMLLKFKTKANWSIRLADESIKERFTISRQTGNGEGDISIQLKPDAEMPLMIPVVITVTSNGLKTRSGSETKEFEKYFMRRVAASGANDVIHDKMGRGLAIFGDLSSKSIREAVFDIDKLNAGNKIQNAGSGADENSVRITGNDYKYVSEQWSNSLNGSVQANVLFGLIPPPFTGSISAMSGSQITTQNYYEYCIYSLYCVPEIGRRKLEDKLYNYTETVTAQYLTKEVVPFMTTEAAEIINGESELFAKTDYESIFRKYGTHVITAADFGGRYDYLYAREDIEYESSVANSGAIGLSGKIPAGLLKSFKVSVDDTYSSKDSVAYRSSKAIEHSRRIGGNIENSLEEWKASFKDAGLDQLELIKLGFSSDQPGRGALPIFMLCLDTERRGKMKTAWIDYIKKNSTQTKESKKIIADVRIRYVSDDDPVEDYFYDSYNGVKLRYTRLPLNLSQVNSWNPKGENYFYYAHSFTDNTEVGITGIDIYNTGSQPDGWVEAGEPGVDSTTGLGGVNYARNKLYVTRRKSNTSEASLITGVKWAHYKTDGVKENGTVKNNKHKGNYFTTGAGDWNTWSNQSSRTWLKDCGLGHQDMILFSTKEKIK